MVRYDGIHNSQRIRFIPILGVAYWLLVYHLVLRSENTLCVCTRFYVDDTSMPLDEMLVCTLQHFTLQNVLVLIITMSP